MAVLIPHIDEIYFSKTREYFEEVISSYGIHNNRSAIVMLYSVTICDLLLKLEELRDSYNDTVAKTILEDIDNSRQSASGSKSEWEMNLVNRIYKQTSFIDNEMYMKLQHLHDYRNMCAHPSVNSAYELYKPTDEETISLILNILNGVFIKPPIYVKNVIDSLSDDLAQKREIYERDKDHLRTYLTNKYYCHMDSNMKIKTARALWKFCFKKTGEPYDTNRFINRMALEILMDDIEGDFIKEIEKDRNYYTVEPEFMLQVHLVIFLAYYPGIYNSLSEVQRFEIDKFLESNVDMEAISLFKYKDFDEFLDNLRIKGTLQNNVVEFLYKKAKITGAEEKLQNILIKYFCDSTSYDMANSRFHHAIEPYIDRFNTEQLLRIITGINENNQLYNRNAAPFDNALVLYWANRRKGNDVDLSNYKNFHYSDSRLEKLTAGKGDDGNILYDL